MIVATRMETLTKDEETGEEKLYLNDLILCKDCKYFEHHESLLESDTCKLIQVKVNNIDFCSRAKKKEEPKEKSNTEIYYEIMSLLHGLKSSYEAKKKILETINRPVKYVTDEYYRKGQINEITDFLAKIESLMTTVEDSTNDLCSLAEKKEEPKSDSENFIDNLLETLVLRNKSLEFLDLWNFNEQTKGYVDGKRAILNNVIQIIKEYKEKK